MLGWVKDKIARKQSPLEALLAGAFKDETEKQALLEGLVGAEGLKPEELVPLLTHADAVVQQRVGNLFLARANPSATHALVDALLTAEGAGRAILLKLVGRLKPDQLRHALDLELKDAKQDRLRSAWELALELPADVSEVYVERGFREGPPKVRADALKRMLVRRSPDQLRDILVQAADDREMRVRRLAVDALVTLAGNEVFEAMLERIARDDNAEIRQIAGGYLQRFIATAPAELRPAIFGRLLLSGDADVRNQLVKAIFSSGRHYETLLEILTFAKTVLGVQHASILDALKPLGDAIVDHAVRVLQHDDPDVRIQGVLLLERYPVSKTVASIVKLTEDPDWWVRIMACEALGRLKDARTLPYLTRLLNDPECKWAAIDAIGSIGGEPGFAALLGLLRDKQNEVRLAAMNALARIDDRRVDAYVEDLSKTDSSLDLRIRAVELLRERRGGQGGGEASVSSAHLTRPIEKLLAYAREANASDLLVSPGEPPFVRLNGVIERLKMKALPATQVEALVDDLLDPVRRPILAEKGSVDFCYAIPGVGRYRVNVFRQLRGVSAVVRVIPNVTPTIAGCGLPKSLEEVGLYHQGIILLTGPAGSGKSTSLTALVNLLNESRHTHILTLEDPIEFLHPPKKALVNQREIGRDSKSFAAAMRGALREDPDVIVVGELRDKETIRLAMIAAETGHLVIATMQTTGAIATIDKLVESFPTDEQAQIRVQLAGSLKLVVSQVLVPKAGGQGRAAAFEILKATSPVAAIIREGKTFQLGSAMQIGRTQGMLTLDAALADLLQRGVITIETAYQYAQKKETFAKAARGGPVASEEPSSVAPGPLDPVPPSTNAPPLQTARAIPPPPAPPSAVAPPPTRQASPPGASMAPNASPHPTMQPGPTPRRSRSKMPAVNQPPGASATQAPSPRTNSRSKMPAVNPAAAQGAPARTTSRSKMPAAGAPSIAPNAAAKPKARIIPRGDE